MIGEQFSLTRPDALERDLMLFSSCCCKSFEPLVVIWTPPLSFALLLAMLMDPLLPYARLTY